MSKKIIVSISVFCLVALFAVGSFAAEQTLRMLVWEGYAPADLRADFVKLVKDKYGVDLKIEVNYVAGNDDFFPALKEGSADMVSAETKSVIDRAKQMYANRLPSGDHSGLRVVPER